MRIIEGDFQVIGVAALLTVPDGRYLMQLRDAIPTIHMPDNWALFGGLVETGETAAGALERELREELGFAPENLTWFTETACFLPGDDPRLIHKTFYEIPATLDEVAAMTLGEGQAMRLFSHAELMILPNVVPWDLFAVTLHARRAEVGRRPTAQSCTGGFLAAHTPMR